MIFTIFRDFSDFIFDLKTLKIIKKGIIFRAGTMWMRRGTQGHVAAPRGSTQRLHDVSIYLYYIYILYSKRYSAF